MSSSKRQKRKKRQERKKTHWENVDNKKISNNNHNRKFENSWNIKYKRKKAVGQEKNLKKQRNNHLWEK